MEKHLMMEPYAPSGGLLEYLVPTSTLGVMATTAVATVSLLAIARRLMAAEALRRPVLLSPLTTVIPAMAADEVKGLLYPPDFFPDSRDVATPYGNIRVVEWGPEDGPRVLFIHGISTSCITLAKIARGLAKRGCRVMLFDLFGRGYSDGVGDLPHDARLYVSQALMAMASSPVSWTGSGKLRVIGYSMGAGIAVHIAAAFPDLVSSLVLIAPAGLIRPVNFGVSRHLFLSGLVPERLLAYFTRKRLHRPIASKQAIQKAQEAAEKAKKAAEKETAEEDLVEVGIAETADPNTAAVNDEDDDYLADIKSRMLGYVQWMTAHHSGFLSAFMSSVRFAPLAEQHASWRAIAQRPRRSTAIILGNYDEVIDMAQFEEDAPPLVGGKEHVWWTVLDGAHDIPVTHAKEILADIDAFWGEQFGS